MNNSYEEEGPDFFEEVQKKVETDVFLNAEAEEEQPDTSPERRPPFVEAEDSEGDALDVQVEIVEPDSDSDIVDLDDSFLEEIDLLPETYGADDTAAGGVSDSTKERGLMSETSRSENAVSLDQGPDFQEDDRYLNELIDREMVRRGLDQGGGVAEGPVFEAPFSAPESGPFGEEESELQTKTLGDLYAQQGHYAKAAEIYEDLLRQDPENRELRVRLDELKGRQAASREHETGYGIETRGGSVPPLPGGRAQMIERLETWLAGIRAEKERRCSRNS